MWKFALLYRTFLRGKSTSRIHFNANSENITIPSAINANIITAANKTAPPKNTQAITLIQLNTSISINPPVYDNLPL